MTGNIEVQNHQTAGQYFIRMAQKRDPMPSTTAEAIAGLAANSVRVTGYTDVIFHRNTKTTLYLTVGREDWTNETVNRISTVDENYSFPTDLSRMYSHFFLLNHEFRTPHPDAVRNRLDLFDHRIADYSMGQCK